MSLSLVSLGSEHLIKSHSSCKGCLEMKGDSVQVYFVNHTRFLCMYMCGWGGACGYTCLCERVAHVHGCQGTTSVVSTRCHALFFEAESFTGLGLTR